MSGEVPLLILGARSFAPEIADLAADVPGFRVAGFVENLEPERCEGSLAGLPILWIEDIGELSATHRALFGLGSTHRRLFVERVEEMGFGFATVVHPTAPVSATTTVGEGSIVSAGAILASHVRVGRHVLVNRGVLVGHHTEIGDFSSIQPGANIASSCRIGEGSYVGMGAIVVDHTSIGAHSVVGAGSVVTKDVAPNVQVVGMPARAIKQGVDGR